MDGLRILTLCNPAVKSGRPDNARSRFAGEVVLSSPANNCDQGNCAMEENKLRYLM